jgi:ubiquinone/menaquinone biosynthesis C-methylase UbiE
MAEPSDRAASFAANQRLWEAWTAVHAEGDFYDLAGFRAGGIRLTDEEIAAVGDVRGRTLLHLQCHFGIDTLSWARLGARVTGADFSPAAIRLAREIAADIGIEDARFVDSNLYELPEHLDGQFDVVYTSRGVLGWLPDIRSWARVVAHFVKPGGTFYILEAHPVIQAFEMEGVAPGELRLTYPYWEHRDPLVFDVKGSYADPDADVGEQKEHGWDHGLGEIVTALIDAGLRIESLEEHPYLHWGADFLVESEPGSGLFVLPPGPGELPLMFSLRATKPLNG